MVKDYIENYTKKSIIKARITEDLICFRKFSQNKLCKIILKDYNRLIEFLEGSMDVLLSKTINELRNTDEYKEKLEAYFSVNIISLIAKPFSDIPLKYLKKLPISAVRSAIDSLLEFITSDDIIIKLDDPRSLPLWKKPPHSYPNEKTSYIVPFLLKDEAPVVIIAPGGSYSNVAFDHEGVQIAKAYNKLGFHAIILNYRVSPARYPAPQLDMIRAVQITKSKAKEWKIADNSIVLVGFSAGGHLCSSTAALHDELLWQSGDLSHIDAKPDALILGYPQIDLCFKVMGIASGVFLLNSNADEKDYKRLSSHNLVNSSYPKTFVWSESDDPFVKVCENSDRFAESLKKANVTHEYKVYKGDMHGVGLAKGRESEAWLLDSLEFLKTQAGICPKQKVKCF